MNDLFFLVIILAALLAYALAGAFTAGLMTRFYRLVERPDLERAARERKQSQRTLFDAAEGHSLKGAAT